MKLSFFLIAILFIFSLDGAEVEFYPQKLAIKMVKIVLKDKNISLSEKVEIKAKGVKTEPMVIYQFIHEESKELKYAVFAQSKGRYDLFDYLVITSLDFSIEKVRVLNYRSEHGGEIASRKWLTQFENYSGGDLRYKKEISALSGATVSANSLVGDIPKVLKILKESCK